MKTIEQFKEEYIANLDITGNLTKTDIIEQNMNAIDAGVEFAQRWIPVKKYQYGYYREQLDQIIDRLPVLILFTNGVIELAKSVDDLPDTTCFFESYRPIYRDWETDRKSVV